MADLGGVFNAEQVDPMGDFSPIPAGEYRCSCIKSEWKNTKSGGRYLEFTWEVLEGEYEKRMLWSRLNLENSSAQAVSIARSELSSICRATGKMKPRTTEELHGIPIYVKVAVKKREDNGEPTNEVKGYKSVREVGEKTAAVGDPEGSGDKPAWM